jgi:hypothetical protein
MDWSFSETARDSDRDCFVYEAHSTMDFEGLNDLWIRVYGTECGWIKNHDGSLYKDRYHDSSTYLLAMVNGVIVGTMRLVSDSSVGLPLEQFVSIQDHRNARTLIECTRLMVVPEFRNRRMQELPFGVLGGLVKGCIQWCVINDVTHIIADLFKNTATTPAEPLIALGFERIGLEFVDTELDEPDQSEALLLRVNELASRGFRTDSQFYRYLTEFDHSVLVSRADIPSSVLTY